MDKRYVVIDMPTPGTDGDIYQEVYTTAEEANSEAAYQWDHLTAAEKHRRHIYAAIAQRENLDEFAVDEDTGETDCASVKPTKGAFD